MFVFFSYVKFMGFRPVALRRCFLRSTSSSCGTRSNTQAQFFVSCIPFVPLWKMAPRQVQLTASVVGFVWSLRLDRPARRAQWSRRCIFESLSWHFVSPVHDMHGRRYHIRAHVYQSARQRLHVAARGVAVCDCCLCTVYRANPIQYPVSPSAVQSSIYETNGSYSAVIWHWHPEQCCI